MNIPSEPPHAYSAATSPLYVEGAQPKRFANATDAPLFAAARKTFESLEAPRERRRSLFFKATSFRERFNPTTMKVNLYTKWRLVRSFKKLNNSENLQLSTEIIKRAVEQCLLLRGDEKSRIGFTIRDETAPLGKEYKFRVVREQNGKISLEFSKFLAAGSFGLVSDVYRISKSGGEKGLIEKIAKPFHQARTDVKREVEILQKLRDANGGKAPIGVQKPPHEIIHISSHDNAEQEVGYLATRYDSDLFSKVYDDSFSHEDRMDCCEQLLHGATFCQKEKLRLGDIKPENCLVKKNSQGKLECHLSDFGGVRSFDEMYDDFSMGGMEFRDLQGSITISYVSRQDMRALSNCKTFEDFKRIEMARDSAALAKTMYTLITGGLDPNFFIDDPDAPIMELHPYDRSNHPDFNYFDRGALEGRVSDTQINILEAMMNPDPFERMLPKQALELWNL